MFPLANVLQNILTNINKRILKCKLFLKHKVDTEHKIL